VRMITIVLYNWISESKYFKMYITNQEELFRKKCQ